MTYFKEFANYQRELEYQRLLNKAKELKLEYGYLKLPKDYKYDDENIDDNFGFFHSEKNESQLDRQNGFKGLFKGKFDKYTSTSMLSTVNNTPTKNKIKIKTEVCPCIDNNGLFNKKINKNIKEAFFVDKNINNLISMKLTNKIPDFEFKNENNPKLSGPENNGVMQNQELSIYQTFKPDLHNNENNNKNYFKTNDKVNTNFNSTINIEDNDIDPSTAENRLLKYKLEKISKMKLELKERINKMNDPNYYISKSEYGNNTFNDNNSIKMKLGSSLESDNEEVRIYLTNQRKYHLKELVPKVIDRSHFIYANISKSTHCITCSRMLKNNLNTKCCPKCHR